MLIEHLNFNNSIYNYCDIKIKKKNFRFKILGVDFLIFKDFKFKQT